MLVYYRPLPSSYSGPAHPALSVRADRRGTPVAQDNIAFIDGNNGDSNDYVAKDVEEAHGEMMEEITW